MDIFYANKKKYKTLGLSSQTNSIE